MSNPKVYIVIVNYKNWQDSRDCLESVLHSAYSNFSVFLIDNDSGNNSLGRLEEWLAGKNGRVENILLKKEALSRMAAVAEWPKVVLIQNDRNEGFAAGNNLVLRFLQHEDAYIWLLNPDMLVKENTMEELVGFAEQQSPGCIIGAKVSSFTGNHGLFFYGGGKVNFALATVQLVKEPAAAAQLDYISGGCLFTRAENFKELGLLPEEYFLYWEETDWCYRGKQGAHQLLVCPTAICYDKISTVIGKGFLSDYYYARNGLLFISKYRNRNMPLVLMAMAARFLKRVMTGQWARARGVYKGTLDYFKWKPGGTSL